MTTGEKGNASTRCADFFQHRDVARDRLRAARLDSAKAGERTRAGIGQACAAALAAGQRLDDGTEIRVERLDELPGAALAHAQMAAGRGARAGLRDRLEQGGLAGSDRGVIVEFQAPMKGTAGRMSLAVSGEIARRRFTGAPSVAHDAF